MGTEQEHSVGTGTRVANPASLRRLANATVVTADESLRDWKQAVVKGQVDMHQADAVLNALLDLRFAATEFTLSYR